MKSCRKLLKRPSKDATGLHLIDFWNNFFCSKKFYARGRSRRRCQTREKFVFLILPFLDWSAAFKCINHDLWFFSISIHSLSFIPYWFTSLSLSLFLCLDSLYFLIYMFISIFIFLAFLSINVYLPLSLCLHISVSSFLYTFIYLSLFVWLVSFSFILYLFISFCVLLLCIS